MLRRYLMILFLVLPIAGCAGLSETGETGKRIDVLEKKVVVLDERQTITEDRLTENEKKITAPQAAVREAPREKKKTAISMSRKKIQGILRDAGYYRGPIDGKMGKKTKKALKDFQTDNGLSPDGIAGPATKEALLRCMSQK